MKRLHHKKTRGPTGKIDPDSPYCELIHLAYCVFKQGPTEHAVCECCMYPDIRADFFNHRQEDLPLEYIRDWFFAAPDIPMDKEPWRFVLPRVLEVLASGEEPSTTGLEVSLDRFPTGEANHWNSDEWAVLDKFQRLYLSRCNTDSQEYLDDIICMFANGGWPTKELFAQISDWPTPKLVEKLWKDWCNYPNPNIWVTAFWKNADIPHRYYTSKALLERVTRFALDDDTPPKLAEKAMAVSDVIHSHAK